MLLEHFDVKKKENTKMHGRKGRTLCIVYDQPSEIKVQKGYANLDKLNTVKLVYGGKVLGPSQFLTLPQLPRKNYTILKNGQKWL